MKYFALKAEVAGGTGPQTIFIDPRARPPLIEKLNYEISGWLGDPILVTVSTFIVTEKLGRRLQFLNATGMSLDAVEITTSHEYEQLRTLRPGPSLPSFLWLKILGTAGKDDFGFTTSNGTCLVVSERVLDLFIECGMKHGKMVELENWKGRKADNFRLQK